MGRYNKCHHLWMDESERAKRTCAGCCDDVQSYAQNTDQIRTQYGQTTKQTSTEKKRKIDTKRRRDRHKIDRIQAGICQSRVLKWIQHYKLLHMFGHKSLHSVVIQQVGRYNKWDHFGVDESVGAESAYAGSCEHARWYAQNTDRILTENQASIDTK